jgi:hypothetical protein
MVELLSLKPFERAAGAADLGGMLKESLPKPRSDEVPAAIQPFSADLVDRGLIQAIYGRIGQPRAVTGGL